jgi:hypothetical protein
MSRSKSVTVTVDVDVHIGEVLDRLSDTEWVKILTETDDATLAKAGLQRIPDEPLDPLTEHLVLTREAHGLI